ncbi:hypothetical protein CR513_41639, partial [Mucuna pruriens]
MISTPLPVEYVKGDEEALKTSFKALEIVGTTSAKSEGGSLKPSKAAIMVAKVLIGHSYQPSKGLGKDLEGIVELTRLHQGYKRGISVKDPTNTTRPLSLLHQWGHCIPRSNCDDKRSAMQLLNSITLTNPIGKTNRKARRKKPWLLEQEGPKLQSGVEELEIINLGEEGETREIKVEKEMPPYLKQRLVVLLKEFADVFA